MASTLGRGMSRICPVLKRPLTNLAQAVNRTLDAPGRYAIGKLRSSLTPQLIHNQNGSPWAAKYAPTVRIAICLNCALVAITPRY